MRGPVLKCFIDTKTQLQEPKGKQEWYKEIEKKGKAL